MIRAKVYAGQRIILTFHEEQEWIEKKHLLLNLQIQE